jgi:AhpD family alkylhydroperoxidase
MARLPYLDLQDIPGPLGEQLRARPPLNIYRVLPHAPAAARGFLALGQAILRDGSLAPALRELVILRVGALSGAGYEVHQHRKLARAVGVSEAKIAATLAADANAASWRAAGLSAPECAALVFTDECVRDVKAGPAAYADLAAHFAAGEQMEIVITLGFYMLVSRLLENFEVEVEAVDVGLGQGHE